jgi:hypothetical protein
MREKKTVGVMIALYCRGQHGRRELCADCGQLLEYALARLDRCRFEEEKPTCARCPVHCYSPGMRGTVKTVMRYSGPRMLFRHPVLACRHMIDGRRATGQKPSPVRGQYK